ncbi:MAG TPA: DUF4124 domain-containing protein [Woeseiaceae bacterium]|nr:DUF4124 domain-containing protein [Woeseiaceae bacterium]
MRRSACIALLAVLAAGVLPAQVYRWVDDDGVIHYSDTPHPGAEEVHLPDSAPPLPGAAFETAQRTLPTEGDQPESQPSFDYRSLRFVAPAPEETLWNIGGELTVRLDLQPGLRPGDQVRVYFDGEPRAVNGLQFEMEEVWRGTHNLQAEVLNEQGQLMIRSEPIRFYVHQTSIANPN